MKQKTSKKINSKQMIRARSKNTTSKRKMLFIFVIFAFIGGGVMVFNSFAATPSTTIGTELKGGQCLTRGQSISYSEAFTYRTTLTMQTDGNVVLSSPVKGTVWHTKTFNTSGSKFCMQTDGNLVLYDTNGKAIWHTRTNGLGMGRTDAIFTLNLDIEYNPTTGQPTYKDGISLTAKSPTLGNGAVWHYWTSQKRDSMGVYWSILTKNQSLISKNGLYNAILQTDGNFVVYGPTGARYNSKTSGKTTIVGMRPATGGSRLGLVDSTDNNVWTTPYNLGTSIDRVSPALMTMQDDGNLVIRKSDGVAIWGSLQASR